MSELSFGQYLPGQSFLHRLNPGVKLLSLGGFILVTNFLNTLYTIYILVFLCAALFYASHLPFRYIITGLRPFLLLFVFTVILHLFFSNRNAEIAWQWGPLAISYSGLKAAMTIGGRFLVIILLSFILILTTSPLLLVKTIVRWAYPLEKLRLPITDLGLMLMVSLRFIPILQEEASRIIEARNIRAGLFRKKGFREKIDAFKDLLFPLFVNLLRRSRELSQTISDRGYARESAPSFISVAKRWESLDKLVLGMTLFICLILILGDLYMTGSFCP